jgi:hydroxyacylglutathione hydrolase
MKRWLIGIGIALLVVAVGIGGLLVGAFAGQARIADGARYGAVEVVKDGFVSASIVELGGSGVALVDTGQDREGRALLGALRRRGLGPSAVKAIFLTHGDYDHTAGAHLFKDAPVYMLGPDVALAEGRAVRGPFRSAHRTGLGVARVLRDGETVEVAATRFEVFALPGHTPGSAAYLAQGVLFLGDGAEISRHSELEGPNRLFSADSPRARASLVDLGRRLRGRASEVKAIECSHSGLLVRGFEPLARFVP